MKLLLFIVAGIASQAQQIDAVERQRVIEGAIGNLKDHYPDAEAARKMIDALRARGDDSSVDGPGFAASLTKLLREASHDLHVDVAYSKNPIPERRPAQPPEAAARYRKAMEESNCNFEKIEMLANSIGYLKLNFFPDISVCKETAAKAMVAVNQASAVIFDLRDNTGGFPYMVSFISAYLFDHPEFLFSPRENVTRESWTASPVAGNHLADKPVYILTSVKTLSGAEQFCYDMKMLKRATLVGETTGGAAHAGIFHRIDDHFGIGFQEIRPINPYSNADWEGTGVEPDVRVKAANALEIAERLADGRLGKK
jgi:hypothetical protein